MPYSDGTLRPWILERIRSVRKERLRIVDIGAGAGLNLDFFKPYLPGSTWTAVEIWGPYVQEFNLLCRYNVVKVGDVRCMELPEADVYLLGDVLEHMERDEALHVWDHARKVAGHVSASLPIVYYPQGCVHGNPYEKHVHHWTAEEVLDAFQGIQDFSTSAIVGAFWAEGHLPVH